MVEESKAENFGGCLTVCCLSGPFSSASIAICEGPACQDSFPMGDHFPVWFGLCLLCLKLLTFQHCMTNFLPLPWKNFSYDEK